MGHKSDHHGLVLLTADDYFIINIIQKPSLQFDDVLYTHAHGLAEKLH